MPNEHAHHEAPGWRVSLIERWPCQIEACRNYGQMCYWAVADEAADHLPITSIVMQYWLAAIARGECTADAPPAAILVQWGAQNLHTLQRREQRREEQREQREKLRSSAAARKASTHKSSRHPSPTRKSSVASKS